MSRPVTDNPSAPGLKRVLGLPLITLYGIGGIIGAGIYVLIGKITAVAGLLSPMGFLVAAFIALFSALSYAELSSRVPSSGGEVTYIQTAFRFNQLSVLVGLAICLGGMVSSAAIARGASGYLQVYVDIAPQLLVVGFVVLATAVACWGVAESVSIAATITALEIAGLGIACMIGGANIPALLDSPMDLLPAAGYADWALVFSAALLAFYAYIGFEDMVNMGDEVVDASRTMPVAIMLALIISTGLYVVVALVFISSVPLDVLASTDAPFVELVQRNSDLPVSSITIISLLAVTNGALVQIIMSARILYGMSKQQLIGPFFSRVSARTQTPVRATLLAGSVVLLFALALPVESLARFTSFILLGVFSLVNLALVVIKWRERSPSAGKSDAGQPVFTVPVVVPVLGSALCFAFLLAQLL